MSKKGRTLRKQSQELLVNIHEYFQREAEIGGPLQSIRAVQKRTADALKISCKTVERVLKRKMECVENDKELYSPGKKRPRKKCATEDCSDFEKEAIRRAVYEMYAKKERVTLLSLSNLLKQRDLYTYSTFSLRQLLISIGFEYKKNRKRGALMEQEQIRLARIQFLREYRQNNLQTVFLNETSISCGQNKPARGKKTSEEGTKYIAVHAGGKNGFIKNASHIFPGELNAGKFETWLKNYLLPNLEEPSLIILDNAPYHNRILNPSPTPAWTKQDIADFLLKLNVPFSDTMLKVELLDLAKEHSQPEKYAVDELVKSHGHKLLRLPPYHCEFNPIEMVWTQCKRFYDEKILLNGSEHEQVLKTWKQSLENVTEENWIFYVSHAENIINQWWEREVCIDSDDILPFIIHSGDDSDSSEDSDSETEHY